MMAGDRTSEFHVGWRNPNGNSSRWHPALKNFGFETALTVGGGAAGYIGSGGNWDAALSGAQMGQFGASVLASTVLRNKLFAACFTAEAPIPCEGGHKRADEVREGDPLWSLDEFDPDGPIQLKRVEEVFVRVAPVISLTIRGRTIRTTKEHPFYVQGKGWTAAGELRKGDLLWTEAKTWLQLDAVEDHGEVETVYNFRVADYHTYFVGCSEWGFSVWAHNAYSGRNEANQRQRLRRGGVDDELSNRIIQQGTGDAVPTTAGDAWANHWRSNTIKELMASPPESRAARIGQLSQDHGLPQAVASHAAQGFPNLKCWECADSMIGALRQRGMGGTIVELNTGNSQGMYGNIWSDRAGMVIGTSGRHRAIMIGDTVYDNQRRKEDAARFRLHLALWLRFGLLA
jgi:hypothetical protein